VLELNPQHALVERLTVDDARLHDWAKLLYDQALLAEGAPLPDPASFVRSLNTLMVELAQPPKADA
jgi:molecular chaperone HtpG